MRMWICGIDCVCKLIGLVAWRVAQVVGGWYLVIALRVVC